jgi:hypothetical protein
MSGFKNLAWGRAMTLFSIYTRRGRFDVCFSYGFRRVGWFWLPDQDWRFFLCHNPDDDGSRRKRDRDLLDELRPRGE